MNLFSCRVSRCRFSVIFNHNSLNKGNRTYLSSKYHVEEATTTSSKAHEAEPCGAGLETVMNCCISAPRPSREASDPGICTSKFTNFSGVALDQIWCLIKEHRCIQGESEMHQSARPTNHLYSVAGFLDLTDYKIK